MHKQPLLSTPWTAGVSSIMPLPEYPRPQLQRRQWQSLNGPWQYEAAVQGGPLPFGRSLAETILVPFPVQSALSGIERGDTAGWYRRSFQVPHSWGNQRVLLNFGAVSWEATVWVNGKLIGSHRGDYSGFTVDITAALHRGGVNELVVGYLNPIGGAGEPVGKQAPGPPSGLLHTASSGIWQTVWLEPVGQAHLAGLALSPDLTRHRLLVTAKAAGSGALQVQVQALAGARVVASAQGRPGSRIALSIPGPQLWWPWRPYLYDLRVLLVRRGRVLDRASSYFGMRSVTLGRVGGSTRILLNGRFVFQTGALDQGYWPDGLYAGPSDAALRFDIAAARGLGFNMLREHAKVQPDRWYLWADRLGLLVWQDIPNMPLTSSHPPTPAARAEFRRELTEIVTQRRSHPSIVSWIPFNEGWQQFDVGGVAAQVKRLDPGALVDAQSGSGNCCDALETPVSDIRDAHLYTGPFAPQPDLRASVAGEFGGILPFAPPAHSWPGTLYSIGSPALAWPLAYITGVLRREYAMLMVQLRTAGLSASIFTELGAYEQELGLLSYDRQVFTVAPGLMRALNRKLVGDSIPLGPVSRQRFTVPAGTSGFWSLAEGRGSLAADTSGFGHALALQPSATWTRGRHGHSALALPGAGAAALTAGPVVDTGRSFTVSAWLRSDLTGQSGSAVTQPGTDGSSFSLGIETDRSTQSQSRAGQVATGFPPPALRTRWTFVAPASPTCTALACGVRANTHYDDGRLSVRSGGWHQLTGLFDLPTRTLEMYVDGQAQDIEHVDSIPGPTGPLILGAGTGVYAAPDSFHGAITGLRTYARPLTPDEVWQLYRAER